MGSKPGASTLIVQAPRLMPMNPNSPFAFDVAVRREGAWSGLSAVIVAPRTGRPTSSLIDAGDANHLRRRR